MRVSESLVLAPGGGGHKTPPTGHSKHTQGPQGLREHLQVSTKGGAAAGKVRHAIPTGSRWGFWRRLGVSPRPRTETVTGLPISEPRVTARQAK